jgi:IS30 family transposase
MSQVNDSTKERGCKHLTLPERETIERMLKAGANKREIARVLRRDPSTVKREIKRGTAEQIRTRRVELKRNYYRPEVITEKYTMYFADTGQRTYETRRQGCGAKNKVIACAEMVKYVEDRILGQEKWSPDAAIGYAKAHKLFEKAFSTKTFYNWADDGLVRVKNIDLLLKVRRRPKKPRKERKRILGKSIDERPPTVNDRVEFGHWEGDGIVGKDRKGQLISLVERTLRIGLLFNAGDRSDGRITEVFDKLQAQYGERFPAIFKTVTFDNGSEFAASGDMERDGRTQVYYAHPYSAFERGTNENWNGIVRRFLPKGTSFVNLTDETTARIAHYINTLPRKRFRYKTPLDLWNEQMSAIL